MIAADVLKQHFDASMAPKFDTKNLRLSETGQCQRRRVYRALGYEPRETPELQGIFQSGHVWEQWAASLLAVRFPDALYEDPAAGKEQICLEVPEFGAQGHCDFLSPSEGLLVECKNIRIGALHFGLPKEDHLNQVQAYLHFLHQQAQKMGSLPWGNKTLRAEILYIPREDPAQYRAFPVAYSPEKGKEIEAELYFLRQCIDVELLPDRPRGVDPKIFPCFYSTADYDVHCPFHEYCWGGVDARNLPHEEPTSVTCEALVGKYAVLRGERTEMAARDKALKEEQAKMEATMARYFPEGPKGAITSAGLVISRTLINRASYAMEKAIGAGIVTREALEPFTSVSSSWRHYVKGAE